MLIRNVAVKVSPFSTGTWLDESRVSTPLSRYPEFAERRSSWRGPGSDLVWVLIETDDPDVFGVGQSRGGVDVVEQLGRRAGEIVRQRPVVAAQQGGERDVGGTRGQVPQRELARRERHRQDPARRVGEGGAV